MTQLAQIMLFALLAVTAENLLFIGGLGFSRVIRAARKPKTIWRYSLLVGIFTFVSTLCGIGLNALLEPAFQTFSMLRTVVFAVCTTVAYLIAVLVLRRFLPTWYRRVEPLLASSAINTIVLSMPFLQHTVNMDVWQALGSSIGTGVAFLFASGVLARTLARYKSADVPSAFRGLPSILIYIGVLSMALFGLTGGKLFF